jgi:hypothetical protein
MPNYCSNTVVVSGDEALLKQFKKVAHQKNNDFLQNLHPMPSDINLNESNSISPAWYEWRIANWGTKWDVNPEITKENKNMIIYTFESAWSPPTHAFQYISNNYPQLNFFMQFEEQGSDFIGQVNYQNGIESDAIEKSYQEHARAKINLEKVVLDNNILSLQLEVTYREDKWNFNDDNFINEQVIIEVLSKEEFNFDNIEKYKVNIKANNINKDNNDFYLLEYYAQENSSEIKIMYEKNKIESSLILDEKEISKDNTIKI